ncbi:beta-glucosidase 12-like [Magnolia sinica]|uniref:beta-glucosidase 12-like n=1 Tax=Magnolia sinica TaxID=86752 RepID=UPI00265B6C0C|nr:beta-glucosidase 12-like [Magnolia sinica]
MALVRSLLLGFFFLIASFSHAGGVPSRDNPARLKRSSFPPGFIFGTASSSYQYEGAVKEDGRGPSIWDTYTNEHPEKIKDHSNGDVAVDSYHRYKEDVKIMKDMGVDAYRFSISWTRILPRGSLSGGVNEEGIRYYNNLINEILSNGLKPFVTIFHWDSPQTLQDEYGGFLSSKIVADFHDYANICFKEFGDRVKHWITINEPLTFSTQYGVGVFPPHNPGTDPYTVAHNLLLSHATTVKLYKDTYQVSQKGKIGITLNSNWMIPYSKSKADHFAAQRLLDFNFGWFLHPVTYGNYPRNMRSNAGNRLPKFTKEQSKMLKGAYDFIGINYYTSNYVIDLPRSNNSTSYLTDQHVNTTVVRNGIPIGPKTGASWLYVYPQGIRDLLVYVKEKYKHPVIYITENGVGELNNNTLPLKEALQDNMRVDYHNKHLFFLAKAIKMDGVDVRGYFAWSLLDNFEWADGYTVRFGLNYVDFKDGLKRYPKKSAIWFRNFLKG